MTFEAKILSLTADIPCGKITTYQILSRKAGSPRAYRACGNALNKNSKPIEIPCHRVVCSNGFVGGYVYGKEEKIKLLKFEGVEIKNDRVVNFEKYLWK